ncbi:hypothetical protein [Bartonella gabonensis]|uniref:hypothetical protein n=1 Tax=Bartonella gabonensis TaxID=2699889 RepID=UPI0031B5DA18
MGKISVKPCQKALCGGECLYRRLCKIDYRTLYHLPDVFTLRDIHQRDWTGLKDHAILKQSLEILCRSNHIRQISSENSSKGSRPTIRYE